MKQYFFNYTISNRWTLQWCTNQALVVLFKSYNYYFFSFFQEVCLLAQNQIYIYAAVAGRLPCSTTKVPLAQKVPDTSNGGFYVFRQEQSPNGVVCITNGRVCVIDSGTPWQTCHNWQHKSSHLQPNTFGELQMHCEPGYMCRSRTNPMKAGLRKVTSLIQRWNMEFWERTQLF